MVETMQRVGRIPFTVETAVKADATLVGKPFRGNLKSPGDIQKLVNHIFWAINRGYVISVIPQENNNAQKAG